jgi:pyruvate,water dikinase
MDRYVLDLPEIDKAQVAVAGGKGAHLGELSHIEGSSVPPGFCITTHAFRSSAAAIVDR